MTLLRTQLGNSLRGHRLRQRRTLRDVSGAARVSLGYLSEVELADLLAEVSQEMRGSDGGLRPVPPAAAAARPAADADVEAALESAAAEPALALVGAGQPARSGLRRGEAVSLAA